MRRNPLFHSELAQSVSSLPREPLSGVRTLHASLGPTTGLNSEPAGVGRKGRRPRVSWVAEAVLLAGFSVAFAVFFLGSVTLVSGPRRVLKECPINSVCEGGRVVGCAKGYRFMGEVCVLESEAEILAREMSLFLGRRIAEANGAAHCEQVPEPTEMRLDQAEPLLKGAFGSRSDYFYEGLVALYQNSLNQLYPELQSVYNLNSFEQTFSSERVVLSRGCAFWQKLAFSGLIGPAWVLGLVFLACLLVRKLRIKRTVAEAEKVYLFARNSVLAKRMMLNIGEFVSSFGSLGRDDEAVLEALDQIRLAEGEIGKIVQEHGVFWTALY